MKEDDIFIYKFEILFRKEVSTNNFRYHENCGMWKWEKTREKGGAQKPLSYVLSTGEFTTHPADSLITS
jgi:hypothetical protein